MTIKNVFFDETNTKFWFILNHIKYINYLVKGFDLTLVGHTIQQLYCIISHFLFHFSCFLHYTP